MNKKFYTHLNLEERETVSRGLAQGQSLRIMRTVLGRTPSTLSREWAVMPRAVPPIVPVRRTRWP